MTVTIEQIEAAKTPAGGWTRAQLAEWGVAWPPQRGWKARLLGGNECTNAWERPHGGGILEIAALALRIKPLCESPIEVMLGAYLWQALGQSDGWRLTPQFKIGRFRYDFAICDTDRADVVVLVECDGKEFHSSPEQIANDRRKDAEADRQRFPIVRFTGADINRDPRSCALIAIDLANQLRKQRR